MNRDISLGIYEDIFDNNKVVFAFYSKDEVLLKRFSGIYNRTYNISLVPEWSDEWKEGSLNRRFSSNEFFDQVEAAFKEELNRYIYVSGLVLEKRDAVISAESASGDV